MLEKEQDGNRSQGCYNYHVPTEVGDLVDSGVDLGFGKNKK